METSPSRSRLLAASVPTSPAGTTAAANIETKTKHVRTAKPRSPEMPLRPIFAIRAPHAFVAPTKPYSTGVFT